MSHILNSAKPVLSISLLSSGRTDTLEKCLGSLTNLRKRVPSELIIIDTGCDDKAKAINEKYTDHIIPFKWIDDFAAARNVGVNAARGEYFMFLDDDEWFEDTLELEDFFLTGAYKEYESGFYIARNYDDIEGSKYSDDYVSRIFSLKTGIRFRSRIHEYPDPLVGKQVRLHSFVHHYGYVYDGDDKKHKAHTDRNVKLLKAMIDEEPDNIRHYAQLALEYKGIKDYKLLRQTCQNGIDACSHIHNPEYKRVISTLYTGMIHSYIGENDLEGALATFYEVIKKDITDFCKAKAYAGAAHSAYNLQKYEECEGYCKAYFDYYDTIGRDENKNFSQSSFFVQDTFEYSTASGMFAYYTVCLLRSGKIKDAKKYFDLMGFPRAQLTLPNDAVLEIIRGMCMNEHDPVFVSMMETMLRRGGVDSMVANAFEILIKVSEYVTPLARIVKSLPSDTPGYSALNDYLDKLEMYLLSQTLKDKIKECMDAGAYNNALLIADQLLAITPDDKELIELKKTILTME